MIPGEARLRRIRIDSTNDAAILAKQDTGFLWAVLKNTSNKVPCICMLTIEKSRIIQNRHSPERMTLFRGFILSVAIANPNIRPSNSSAPDNVENIQETRITYIDSNAV